ncbi:MAG TPA: glycosyltransferase family 2 protein [Methylophilaceae bacterium]
MGLIATLYVVVLLLLAIPVVLFVLEILVSLLPYRHPSLQEHHRWPSLAVLIPAHNEQQGIAHTIRSVQAQLDEGDRMIVIADNCTDETAAVARKHGATVIERTDPTRRGKGYALDFGVRYLEQDSPPEVVIIIDADCMLQQDCLTLLAVDAMHKNRPVQGLNLVVAAAGAGLKTKIAEFALVVKNQARALGYHRLGLPCQLMGTGMAFPWQLIRQADLANGHIVEDLKLGLEFASQGMAPVLCPEAVVRSLFPLNRAGLNSQRTRWEHGHLGMMIKEGPRMIVKSIRDFNPATLAMALDMMVPPLALLALIVLAVALFSGVMMIATHQYLPWSAGLLLPLLLGSAVILAWARFGRGILTLSDLAYVPVYMLEKIPLYCRFLVKRQVEWVRSQRD